MKRYFLVFALLFWICLALPLQASDLSDYLSQNTVLDGFWNDAGTRLITITERRIDTWKIEKGRAVRVGSIDEATSRTEVFPHRGKNARFLTDTGRPWAGKNYNLTVSWDGRFWAYRPPPRRKDPYRNSIIVDRFDSRYKPGKVSGDALVLQLPAGHRGKKHLAFSPDGTELAGYMAINKQYDFYLFIWSLDTGQIIKKVRLWQPEGKKKLLDYGYVKWEKEERIGVPKGWLSYSPDGRYLVAGGRSRIKKKLKDGSGAWFWFDAFQDIRVIMARETLSPFFPGTEGVKMPKLVAFSRDGRTAFFSYHYGDDIKAFSLPDWKKAGSFKHYGGWDLAAPGPPGLMGGISHKRFKEYLVDMDQTPFLTERSRVNLPAPVLDLAYNGEAGVWLAFTLKSGIGIKAGDPEEIAAEKKTAKAVDMMQAGFVEPGTDALMAALAAAPEGGRKIVTARLMFKTLKGVPAQFRSRILADHVARMVSLDTEDSLEAAVKRLVEYGMLATGAGHPRMVGAAAEQVETLGREKAGRLDREFADDALGLLTALHKAMTAGSDDAYTYMLNRGNPGEYAKTLFKRYPDLLYPLFADAKKLSFLLKIPVEKLPTPDTGPRPVQPFTSLDGRPVEPSQDIGAGASPGAGQTPAGTLLD